ncbi:MAG: NAD(P)-dependent oxidoreductase [Rhodospirillales bacterium]|nr:NAD(P)-dependent oxidoreductase [Rhodospirillales bacterium]
MPPTVAVIAPGAMGSAVAARLVAHGVEVRTALDGRSTATAARAAKAGMRAVAAADIAACDIILSIVPPAQAVGLAERIAPALAAERRKPVYADCNAVSPATVARIAAVLAPTGCAFVDGGIIGPPPAADAHATRIYLSGPQAGRVAVLGGYGLDLPVLDGPVGFASAMKLSYAGITKGFTALGTMMLLAATRAGTAAPLRAELERSQPQLLAWLVRQGPRMPDKAYRWVAEMEEIAAFTAEDPAAAASFAAAARLYARIAADRAADGTETAALLRVLAPAS